MLYAELTKNRMLTQMRMILLYRVDLALNFPANKTAIFAICGFNFFSKKRGAKSKVLYLNASGI